MSKIIFPSPPQRYRAEFVRSDGPWSRHFCDGDKSRIESYNRFGGCQVMVRRLDLGVGWGFGRTSVDVVEIVFTRDDLARVMRLEDMYDWTVGKIEGFEDTPVIEYVGRSKDNGDIAETILFYREWGLPLRKLTFNKLGQQVLEIRTRAVSFEAIDQSLFELPEGGRVKRLGGKRGKRPS